MILSTHGIVGSQITQFVGLLDAYPNAAAAYSLRKLRAAYSGSAIRVRRANDNTEQNIGFTALGELDTTTLTSFCSGTNGFVKTWYDQSGNSNDATQATAANQPQIVSSGSFVGFVDFLGTSSVALITNYSYINTQGFTSFGIVQNNGNAVFFSSDNANIFSGVAESGSSVASYQVPQFVSLQNFKNGITLGLTRNDMHNATTSFACITTQAQMYNIPKLIFGYPVVGAYNNIRYKEFVLYNNQTISRSGVESNIITYYGL